MRTLRTRLIVSAFIWTALGVAAAGAVLSAVFRQHVTEQFHEELFVHLDELKRLAKIDASGAQLQRSFSDPRYDLSQSGFYWEIQREGRVIARSASLQGAILRTPNDNAADTVAHTHEIAGPTGRMLVAERAEWNNPSEPPLRFLVGTDARHLEVVMRRFDNTLYGALGALAAAMIAAASLLIMLALRPLTQLRAGLASVRSGSSKSLDGRFPLEVQPLVDDLNSLLSNSSELIQRARTQAGNLAHGLRTPLAILTDEAYRIKDQGLAQASVTILDQCRRMQTQIEYQVARARAVAMRATPGTIASTLKSASEVTTALARLHKDRSIAIENRVPEMLDVACDAQDLNEMLGNLADNACKHCKSSVHMSASAVHPGNKIVIVVEDDGPGLPPEAYEVVFNIGERWDSNKPGAGLGLAIVRDLARLYGGDVRLGLSPLGGLAVSLELPRANAIG